MYVKTLMEQLKKLPQDLDVVIETDHGQTPMHVTYVGLSHVKDKSEYMMESVAEEDLKEYPDAAKIIVIQGY